MFRKEIFCFSFSRESWFYVDVLLLSTKGPICVSYTVFHDPVGRSSERIHNQKKRDDGISSGRGGKKRLAQCQGTQSSARGRRIVVSFGCVFSLTIDLLGRETPCKRNKLVLSL